MDFLKSMPRIIISLEKERKGRNIGNFFFTVTV